jgi:hypothetical protein
MSRTSTGMVESMAIVSIVSDDSAFFTDAADKAGASSWSLVRGPCGCAYGARLADDASDSSLVWWW